MPRHPAWEGGDDAAVCVGEEHGDAVGGLDPEQEAGGCGDEAVGFVEGAAFTVGPAGCGVCDQADVGAVDLAYGDDGQAFDSADGFGDAAAIFADGFGAHHLW